MRPALPTGWATTSQPPHCRQAREEIARRKSFGSQELTAAASAAASRSCSAGPLALPPAGLPALLLPARDAGSSSARLDFSSGCSSGCSCARGDSCARAKARAWVGVGPLPPLLGSPTAEGPPLPSSRRRKLQRRTRKVASGWSSQKEGVTWRSCSSTCPPSKQASKQVTGEVRIRSGRSQHTTPCLFKHPLLHDNTVSENFFAHNCSQTTPRCKQGSTNQRAAHLL